MTDQQVALQAMSDAHRILEEYLEPRPTMISVFLRGSLRFLSGQRSSWRSTACSAPKGVPLSLHEWQRRLIF
jgi:hypothetical protein